MQAFAIKAAREGKEQTSWLDPDERYEAGLKQFVHDVLDQARSADFIESFGGFADRVALLGALNSLTQVTLKATMPGVPDFYQGTELWDLSLVDPDNRRPVDFSARARALQSLAEIPDWTTLRKTWPDGRIKLALTIGRSTSKARIPTRSWDLRAALAVTRLSSSWPGCSIVRPGTGANGHRVATGTQPLWSMDFLRCSHCSPPGRRQWGRSLRSLRFSMSFRSLFCGQARPAAAIERPPGV
jgi:hypothetical protein